MTKKALFKASLASIRCQAKLVNTNQGYILQLKPYSVKELETQLAKRGIYGDYKDICNHLRQCPVARVEFHLTSRLENGRIKEVEKGG